MNKLNVYINTDEIGVLANESEKFVFTYSPSATHPISVTMPIRTQSWVTDKMNTNICLNQEQLFILIKEDYKSPK